MSLALVQASGALVPFDHVTETAGAGVETLVAGEPLRLGSPAFCGVEDAEVRKVLTQHPGVSLLAVRWGSQTPRLLPISQKLRPDAVETVAALKAQGYLLEILSGDRQDAVRAAAEELGIDHWQAEVRPGDKIARLDELKAAGRKVLMVGDGLNDAPALAGAYVSLSPVTAVHLSQTAADAVFLGDRLAPVVNTLRISKKARRAIEQNLWISALYNVIAVPVAVAGFVTPLMAAVAMSASSIAVTANALRLRWGEKLPDSRAE